MLKKSSHDSGRNGLQKPIARSIACLVTLLGLSANALAADLPGRHEAPPPPAPLALVHQPLWGIISEVRLGAFAHDPWSPERGGVDLNAEVLSIKPFHTDDPRWDFLAPRFHLGGTANFAGKTSHVYAGVTWDYDVTDWLFVEGTFGGSVNNGKSDPVPTFDRNALGCHVMFRESASLGFHLTQSINLMGTIEHISNAGLCNNNRGLTNLGVRLGYVF